MSDTVKYSESWLLDALVRGYYNSKEVNQSITNNHQHSVMTIPQPAIVDQLGCLIWCQSEIQYYLKFVTN